MKIKNGPSEIVSTYCILERVKTILGTISILKTIFCQKITQTELISIPKVVKVEWFLGRKWTSILIWYVKLSFYIFLLSKYLPLVWASIMALYMPSPNSFSPITWNSYLVRGVKLWILTFLASGGLIGNSSQFLDFGSDSRYLKRDWNCKMKPMC